MADTGPNGPCSEIFSGIKVKSMAPQEGPENPESDERLIVEIWNLVFMQYDQQADGQQIPLPKPSIDAGAGFRASPLSNPKCRCSLGT